MYVITPAFARYAHHAATWPLLRARAGCPIHWIIAVDGSANTPWHTVGENLTLAGELADEVIDLGYHQGNGRATQRAVERIPEGLPFINADADVLPCQDFARIFLDLQAQIADPALGLIAAAYAPRTRPARMPWQRMPANRRIGLACAFYTLAGRAAIPDHTTGVPINGHDLLVTRALWLAGLWIAQTDRVFIDRHASAHDGPDTPYNRWKAPYLSGRGEIG